MNQDYQIKLEIFEGPLDLLLYLVTKDEVDIKDIQVARVCEQFLQYLELMKDLNVEVAGEYLVMASTLIRLKARELLPQDVTSELLPEGEIVNREQLIKQLEEYRKYKEAAKSLQKMENVHRSTFYKAVPEKVEWAEEFVEQGIEVGIFDLLSAFKRVMEQLPAESFHNVARDDVKLDVRIEYIIGYTQDHGQCRFEDLFAGARSKMMVVVTFMAILELMKMEYISIRQENQFGQIWVYKREKQNVDTPAAEPVGEEQSTSGE